MLLGNKLYKTISNCPISILLLAMLHYCTALFSGGQTNRILRDIGLAQLKKKLVLISLIFFFDFLDGFVLEVLFLYRRTFTENPNPLV